MQPILGSALGSAGSTRYTTKSPSSSSAEGFVPHSHPSTGHLIASERPASSEITSVRASPDESQARSVGEIQRLNKTGVAQMREGLLSEALATLQLAQSLCSALADRDVDEVDEPGSSSAPLSTSDSAALSQVLSVKSSTLNNLGCLYRRLGRLDEAVHYLQRARDIESLYGPRLRSTPLVVDATSELGAMQYVSVSTLLNLSSVHLALGNMDEALATATVAARKAQEASGGSASANQEYVVALHNLAVAQQSAPNSQDRRHAASTMLRALAASEQFLGETHPTTQMLRAKCGVPHIPGGTTAAAGISAMAPKQPRVPQQPALSATGPTFSRSSAAASRQSPVGGASNGAATPVGPPTTGAASSTSSLRRSDVDLARMALRSVEDCLPAVRVPPAKAAAAPPSISVGGVGDAQDADVVMQGAAFVDGAIPPEETNKSPILDDMCVTAPSDSIEPRTVADGVKNEEVAPQLTSDHGEDPVLPAPDASVTHDAENAVPKTMAAPPIPQSHVAQQAQTLPPHPLPPPTLTSRELALHQQQQQQSANVVRPSSHSNHSIATSSQQPQRLGSASVRSTASAVLPPPFMRFAPMNALPPPLPTTFHDIRIELKIEREQRMMAEATAKRSKSFSEGMLSGGRSGATYQNQKVPANGTASTQQLMKAAVQRKHARAVAEAAEEQMLREKFAKEQRAKLDEIKRQRLEAFQLERRHGAARKIQRLWRWWWRNVGYRKYVAATQRQADSEKDATMEAVHGHLPQSSSGVSSSATTVAKVARSTTNKSKSSSSTAASNRRLTAGTAGQASSQLRNVSRAVVRCANRWLSKTSGGRLLRRILATQRSNGGSFSPILRSIYNMQDLVNLMRRVQAVWRGAVARSRYVRRREAFEGRLEIARDICRRNAAAKRIQCAWRSHEARVELRTRRTAFMLGFALRIQRWFRKLQRARVSAGARLRGVHTRTQAAVAIQRCWRGYCGRLQATMLRIKQKMHAMRAKERYRAVLLQRVARAFQTRRALGVLSHDAKRTSSHPLQVLERQRVLELQRQAAASADSALRRVSEKWSRYTSSIDQRSREAASIREEERRLIMLPIAVDSVAVRERQAVSERIQPHELRLERAAEEHTRLRELATLQRFRAARVIQRAYRRWKRLVTAERGRHITYATRVYVQRSFNAKESARKEASERARLRTTNDLGKDAREAKQAAQLEIQEIREHVRTEYAVNYHADALRNQADRRVVARNIKSREVELAHQTAQDLASLRLTSEITLPPSTTTQETHLPPTFLTSRQRRLLEQHQSGNS